MTFEARADIGVIGGSGFYSLLESVHEVPVSTPYGPPSDSLFFADVDGRGVAFLPRHGRSHTIPPHQINYRANIWAMHQAGVRYLISPCAAGSLQKQVRPEDFVVCDQFVDRTRGRKDTFFDGPEVAHLSAAEPYCPHLRQMAIEVIESHNIRVHTRGTVVVVQGPRFSTRAESQWFTRAGWEVISMTQYPESYLALELGIAPVNISLITDYDVGLVADGEVPAVTTSEVMAVLQKNSDRIRGVVLDLIRRIPRELDSPCHHLAEVAKVGGS